MKKQKKNDNKVLTERKFTFFIIQYFNKNICQNYTQEQIRKYTSNVKVISLVFALCTTNKFLTCRDFLPQNICFKQSKIFSALIIDIQLNNVNKTLFSVLNLQRKKRETLNMSNEFRQNN